MPAYGEENGTEATSHMNGHGEKHVDYLIVGTGPAGGSLACFLAQNGWSTNDEGSNASAKLDTGLKGLMISNQPSNADTPRAHITNMAALGTLRGSIPTSRSLLTVTDCLRDIGLDEECYRVGTSGDCMVHTRWSHSMAGEEYARIFSWGNSPRRKVC